MACVRVFFFHKNRPRFVGTKNKKIYYKYLGPAILSVESVLECICVGLRRSFLRNAGFCPPAEIQDYLQKMGL